MEVAGERNWPCLKTIEHILDLELEVRKQNRIILSFRQSKLNEKPTIDQFDFNHHASRKKQKTIEIKEIPGVFRAPNGHHLDWQSRRR